MLPISTPKSQKTEDPQTKVSYGIGRSDANGNQIPVAVVRRSTSLYTLAVAIRRHSKVGPKSECPCIYVGIPRVEEDSESAKKSNVLGVDLVAPDLDGCIRSDADLEEVLKVFEGKGYILHTSSSHNPDGGHPKEEKRGQHRYGMIIPWSRRLTYSEHKAATLELLAELAGVLGHDASEVPSSRLSTWLLSRGLDPACSRAMQPRYFPRHPNQAVAAQAYVRHEEGEPIDPDPYLEAHEARQKRSQKTRKKIPPRPAQLREGWSPEEEAATPAPVLDEEMIASVDVDTKIRRARAYLRKLGPCRVGGGGHELGFKGILACWGLDLELEDAWTVIQEWNHQHDPERVVTRRRLEAAYRGGITTPRGALLAPREETLPEVCPEFEDVEIVGVARPPLKERENPGSGQTPQSADSPPLARSPLKEKEKVGSGQTPRRFLPKHHIDHIRARRVTFVRAPQGAGKTHALRGLVQNITALGGRVVYVCHRQALTRSAASTLGLPCYLNAPKGTSFSGSVAICLDSIDRVDLWGDAADEQVITVRPIALVIVDESEQVVRHTFGRTILGKRRLQAVWSHFRALLQSSEHVIFQDADLGRLTLKTSRLVLGKSSEQKLEHDYRPHRRVLSYVHQDRHTEDFSKAVQARAEGGERVFFGSCSRTRIDEVDAQVSAMGLGLRVLKVTQRTAGLPEVRDFLADPSLATQYDIILASPTLGTGVSIDVCPFLVFFDALAGAGSIATDVIQALCRVRNPVDGTWRVHVRGHAPWSEKDPDIIKKNMCRVGKETADALSRISTWAPGFTAEGERCLSPDNADLVDLCAHVRSVEAVGADLEKMLPLLWRSYGYAVEVVEDEPEDNEAQKSAKVAAKESLHNADVERVLAAPVLSEEDAQELETSAQTPEAEAALRAHRIRDLYGIEEVTRDLVEVYDQGRHVRIVHRFVDLLNWQTRHRHAVLIKDHNALARTGGATLPEVRGYALQADLEAKLWALLGVENLLEDAAKGTPLKSFSALPKTSVDRIKAILGWDVGKLTSNQIAGQLARRCGVKLKSERTTVDGKRKRVYRLDLDAVSRMRELSQAQIDKSRRVEKEETFPGAESIDLEEIRLLMIKEFAA